MDYTRYPQPKTAPDLVDLLRALADDFRSDPTEWEAQTLDAYLDALALWMDDTEGNWEELDFAELGALFAIGKHRDR